MDGLLNVFKPSGPTSHDVVNYLRRLISIKKVGHTGTLDPEAAGVLVVCLGKATRIIRYLKSDKSYRAEVTFGVATDTGDSSGEVLRCTDASLLTREKVEAALQFFKGEIDQVPPMTSAVKYQGQRLYKLARRGQVVEREPRRVVIYDLQLIDFYGRGTKTPFACLELSCSAGTYVRTLCVDLGERLGCGAHMSFLLRTGVGPFALKDSLTLDRISDLYHQDCLKDKLIDLSSALTHIQAVYVKPTAALAVKSGNRLYPPGVFGFVPPVEKGQLVKLVCGEDVLAIAKKQGECLDYFQPLTVL